MWINISALIVFLLIFYVVFFGKEHFQRRYVGGLYNQCDTMHIYILTKTKLKYVVTLSPLRDHLKTIEMKIKKTLAMET